MCKGNCGCKKEIRGQFISEKGKKTKRVIFLTEEEKDLLVKLLNNMLFRVHDLVVADKILNKIDSAFPIMEE